MYFISHHVFESLIEDGSAEHVAIDVLSGRARDEGVFTCIGEPIVH